jgi:hypothetical protein
MSYMRKGFLIYDEIRKYLVIFEEAVSHIWLCNRSLLNYEENLIIFFISVLYTASYPFFLTVNVNMALLDSVLIYIIHNYTGIS